MARNFDFISLVMCSHSGALSRTGVYDDISFFPLALFFFSLSVHLPISSAAVCLPCHPSRARVEEAREFNHGASTQEAAGAK